MDINEIIEKLKDILSSEHPNRKIFDKDVASALGMSKESLSHLKEKKWCSLWTNCKVLCKKKNLNQLDFIWTATKIIRRRNRKIYKNKTFYKN